jgi:hypothetical protein
MLEFQNCLRIFGAFATRSPADAEIRCCREVFAFCDAARASGNRNGAGCTPGCRLVHNSGFSGQQQCATDGVGGWQGPPDPRPHGSTGAVSTNYYEFNAGFNDGNITRSAAWYYSPIYMGNTSNGSTSLNFASGNLAIAPWLVR